MIRKPKLSDDTVTIGETRQLFADIPAGASAVRLLSAGS
jgi:hypothetical protein